MTTKVITGTYSAGYTLQAPITTLSITASGYVAGNGVATAAGATGAYDVVNYGRITAAGNGVGVDLSGGGSVANFGTVASGGTGIVLASGLVVNGSALGTGARVESHGIGVYFGARGGTLANFGAILSQAEVFGSSAGVFGEGAVRIVNGATADTSARIEGYSGVRLQAGGAATNFGTILGTDMFGAGAVLASGGNVANGAVGDTSALIEGHIGVSLVGAGVLTNFGTISGFGGGNAVMLTSAADKLVVEAGSRFIGAVVGGGGTLDLASGSGTIAGAAGGGLKVTVGAAAGIFNGFGVVDIAAAGHFALAARLDIGGILDDGASTLRVAAGGAVLSGGGRIYLGGGTVEGVAASAKLTNVSNLIDGGGALGNGQMVLVNQAQGIIRGDLPTVLTIDTGTNLIVNSGLIEATGVGAVIIDGALDNAGTLYADGGDITVAGAVNNVGVVRISAATADFAAAFQQNVIFGASGVLELMLSRTYTGTIAGFSKTGATSLDLGDIAFAAATKASFSGGASSGVLTVTDGTHTSKLQLAGDYRASTFVVSADGHGGTAVTDPVGPTATPRAFASAMASLAGHCGGALIAPATTTSAPTLLAPPFRA